MGLLFFSYLFVAVFVFDVFCLKFYTRRAYALLANIALVSGVASFFLSLSLTAVLYGKMNIQAFLFKIALIFFTHASYLFSDMAYQLPYFKKNKRFFLCNTTIHLFGILIIIFGMGPFKWNVLVSFKFYQNYLFSSVSGIVLYAALFFLIIPCVTFATLVKKAFMMKSIAYRQQLLFLAGAVALGFITWVIILFLFAVFPWVFVFFPLGGVFIVLFSQWAFASTGIVSFKEVVFALSRFVLCTVGFSCTAGYISVFWVHRFSTLDMQFVFGFFIVYALFALRDYAFDACSVFFGEIADSGQKLAAELQALDYTAKPAQVLRTFMDTLRMRIACRGLTFLLADEAGVFKTVYSDFEEMATHEMEHQSLQYFFNQDVLMIRKSDPVIDHARQAIRTDILHFFDITHAQMIVLIREAQKLIGCLCFGMKNNGVEYSNHDQHVLEKLYSHFVLVSYYLQNIAKQDVVITVDKELKMSHQIIESIQRKRDFIQDASVEVDSIAYSAHQLGGDFVDFIKLSEKRYLLVIGDVSGKGLAASMSMVILKSVLSTFLRGLCLEETAVFTTFIEKINRFIKDNLPCGTFFAGVFCILDLATHTLYYANCGIPLMSMYVAS